MRRSLAVPLVAILNQCIALYNADKTVFAVYDGHKVLPHSGMNKVVDVRIDGHTRIVVFARDRHQRRVLGRGKVQPGVIFNKPQKVALRHGAHIFARTVENGNGGISVIFHLFKGLTKGKIVV